MPNSPVLWMAAGLLWILDASINVSMEPFRAFVGDQLPTRQRPTGYAMQSFFIGVGAVVAARAAVDAGAIRRRQRGAGRRHPRHGEIRVLLPAARCCSARCCGRSCARANTRPSSCSRSPTAPPTAGRWTPRDAWRMRGVAAAGWSSVAVLFAIRHFALDKEFYVLAGGLLVFGLLFAGSSFSRGRGMLREDDGRPATACPPRCAGWPGCSSSRGSRCSRCGSTPPRA